MATNPTQARELLDLVLSFPQSDAYSIRFEYDTNGRCDLWLHGSKTCECCGKLKDICEHLSFKEVNDEVRQWIEDKRKYFEEAKND